jgi:hypothetical protein
MDFKSFIVIFLMAFSVNVSAENLYSCATGCNNLSKEALNIPRNSSPGTRYSVIDFNNNKAKTFVSELFYNTNYGEPLERAVEVTTFSNAVNTLNEINAAIREAESYRYQVPTSISSSVYDLLAQAFGCVRVLYNNILEKTKAQLSTDNSLQIINIT